MRPTFEFGITDYAHMSQGNSGSRPVTQLSQGSSPEFSQDPSSYTTPNPGTTSMPGDSCEPNQNFSSPGSVEVTSDIFITNNGMDHLDGTNAQALRQLEEQLSLNEDSLEGISPSYSYHEILHDLNPQQDQRVIYKLDKSAGFTGPIDCGQPYDEYNGRQGNLDKLELLRIHTC